MTKRITLPAYPGVGNTLCCVKYFLIYTAARIGLFLACWAVLLTIGALLFDDDRAVAIGAIVAAAVISSILSLKMLNGPREKFAQAVQARAERAKARFDEVKTAEDPDGQ